jgi:hypothetical protein
MITEQVPSEFLVLIGGIVIQFNILENLLTVILVQLTGNDFLDVKAHIPFTGMGFGVKKALVDLLIKTKDGMIKGSPTDSYYTSSLRTNLDKVQDRRNSVAHSIWSSDSGKITRRRFKSKKAELESVIVEKIELEELLIAIEDCRVKLTTLILYERSLKQRPQIGQYLKTSSGSTPSEE